MLFLFIGFNLLNAQSNYYYYYKGEKVYLTLHKKHFYIFTDNNFLVSSLEGKGFEKFTLIDDDTVNEKKFAHLELSIEPNDEEYYQKLELLKQLPNIENVGLFFDRFDSAPIGISKYFYVKLKNINDYKVLENIASQKKVQIIKGVSSMPEWYVLAPLNNNSASSSLELCNQFYETGLFADVDPAFMFNFGSDNEEKYQILPQQTSILAT